MPTNCFVWNCERRRFIRSTTTTKPYSFVCHRHTFQPAMRMSPPVGPLHIYTHIKANPQPNHCATAQRYHKIQSLVSNDFMPFARSLCWTTTRGRRNPCWVFASFVVCLRRDFRARARAKIRCNSAIICGMRVEGLCVAANLFRCPAQLAR